jgi:hypothetical protein
MERGNSPQRSEEVDDSPMTQRRRMGDRAFTGSGHQLRTGGISMGTLFHRQALPGAQVGSSGPMVERMEEQELIHAATADVEGRANVLIRQLEDADHHGIDKSLPFCFLPFFLYISFLIVDVISCVRGDRGARGSPHCGRCLPGLPGSSPRS